MDELELTLERAQSLCERRHPVSFPGEQDLNAQSHASPPDFEAFFRSGADVYLRPEKTDRVGRIKAAVSLYLSWENPPSAVRYAIVRLLRDGGAYREALAYAASFMEEDSWNLLLLGAFPLLRPDGLHIDHLTVGGADFSGVLAALMTYMHDIEDANQRRGVIAACMDAFRPERMTFCKALCLLMVCLLAEEGAFSEANVESWMARLGTRARYAEWREDAETLFRLYADGFSPESVPIAQTANVSAWRERGRRFDRAYAGKTRQGWIVCQKGEPSAFFLWLPESALFYKLSPDETEMFSDDLWEGLKREAVPQAHFRMDGERRLLGLKILNIHMRTPLFDWYGKTERMKNFPDYKDYVPLFDALDRRLKDYQYAYQQRKKLYWQFDKCVKTPGHNPERAKALINELEGSMDERYRQKEDEKYLLEFFKYYLHINDYFSIGLLLKRHRSEGLSNLYEQAGILLNDRLKSRSNFSVPRVPLNDRTNDRTKKTKNEKLKGFDVFLRFRYERAMLELADDYGAVSSAGDAEDMERKAAMSRDFAEKSSLYLKAAALYDAQKSEAGATERAKECAVKAFSCLAKEQTLNPDTVSAYCLLLLRLKDDLPRRPPELNNIIGDAVLRCFNPRFLFNDGFQFNEGALESAIRKMVEEDGWMKTGTRLLHLIFCDPSVLEKPFGYQGVLSDPEIRGHFKSVFTQLFPAEAMSAAANANFLDALRIWRNKLAETYNNYASKLCSETLRKMGAKIQEVQILFHQLLNSQDPQEVQLRYFLTLWSREEETYLRDFQSLLRDTVSLLKAADYHRLSKHAERCRDFLAHMEERPPLYAFLLIRYPLLLISRHTEKQLEELRGELRPLLQVEPLFAEVPAAGYLRLYVRVRCAGRNSAIEVKARLNAREVFQRVCDYADNERNGYGFLDMPSAQTYQEGETVRVTTEFRFRAGETREERNKSFDLEFPFHSRLLHVPYKRVYNCWRAMDGATREDQCTFTGRQELIDRICDRFRNAPGSVILLYGQKRVGKTSLSNYIRKQLKEDRRLLVAERQNINQDIKDSSARTETFVREFYRNALIGIKNAFDAPENASRRACMRDEIRMIEETEKTLASKEREMDTQSCRKLFTETMRAVYQGFERNPQWRGAHILLCYDEFQNYYIQILKKILQPDFLDFIKAFKEAEPPISLLLVGNELMIPFMESSSGNASSVIQKEPVRYLRTPDARKLIAEPIPRMMNGGVPNPFFYIEDEILRLSAGSPLYIQWICERLTDALNLEKRVFATMDMLLEIFQDNLRSELFDNLSNPSDDRSDEPRVDGIQFASRKDNNSVLQQIAIRQGMRMEGKRLGSTLPEIERELEGQTEKPVRQIVEELCKRQVLEYAGENLRITVPLYESWVWNGSP